MVEKIQSEKANFSLVELHENLKHRPAYKQIIGFVQEIRQHIENEENIFYAKWLPLDWRWRWLRRM